jgi:hypothetical protein
LWHQVIDVSAIIVYGPAMHGQHPTTPLNAAAKEMASVAREVKSPWFERVAMVAMITSALATAGTAIMQTLHMIRRDLKEDRKERERERRAETASPPPDRPGHGDHATTASDGDRRWTRREEHAAGHGWQR